MSEWDRPNPFTQVIEVKPEHIDTFNHVNNACYVQWCEEVSWRHSEDRGLGLDAYRALNAAMVVRHSEFDYLKAARLGDTVEIAPWVVASDGRLRLSRAYQVVDFKTRESLFRGRVDFVCVALDSGKPRRMPVEFSGAYLVTAEGDS